MTVTDDAMDVTQTENRRSRNGAQSFSGKAWVRQGWEKQALSSTPRTCGSVKRNPGRIVPIRSPTAQGQRSQACSDGNHQIAVQ
jgi:hypothetical protein